MKRSFLGSSHRGSGLAGGAITPRNIGASGPADINKCSMMFKEMGFSFLDGVVLLVWTDSFEIFLVIVVKNSTSHRLCPSLTAL